MVTPTSRRTQPRRAACVAGVCLAALATPAAADDLSNRAFQLNFDASGITSLKRTGDLADTDYIAAGGALGRLSVRCRTSPHGDWKELRDLLLKPGSAPRAASSDADAYTRNPGGGRTPPGFVFRPGSRI